MLVAVAIRIIAATHRNLRAMVKEETFREDLYYRLVVVPITLPPLRERSADIPLLVQHFFTKCRAKHDRPELTMPGNLITYFTRYDWPGNIRQLENAVERMVLLARTHQVTFADLPDFLHSQQSEFMNHATPVPVLPEQGMSLEDLQKEIILQALRKFGGNQTRAARYLNLSRRSFGYRLEKYGVRGQAFKTMGQVAE